MPSTFHPGASEVPTDDLASELRAILTGAAFAPLDDIGWLRITGPDATRWLNGMVTNAINALAPGEGCYNFMLNAQGRILGDCTIYRDPTPEPPVFLLRTDASQIEAIQSHLDRFIIMDDVEMERTDPRLRAGIFIAGAKAQEVLAENRVNMGPLHMTSLQWRSGQVDAFHAISPLAPRFEIFSDVKTIDALHQTLVAIGGIRVSPLALEALRILSGIPKYGVDIRNTDKVHDLPQETAQDRALHFTKGCYLGQEIVERIRSRGSVHRIFTGFILTGDLPPAATELTTESAPRSVGELTSVATITRAALDPGAQSNAPPFHIALGYLRREVLDRNVPVSYTGGTAVPASLPFKLP